MKNMLPGDSNSDVNVFYNGGDMDIRRIKCAIVAIIIGAVSIFCIPAALGMLVYILLVNITEE